MTIKISETEWTHFVLIMEDDENRELLHSIGYVGLPNVVSLMENFTELKNDGDFKIDDLDGKLVNIVSKEKYITLVGDFEIDVED